MTKRTPEQIKAAFDKGAAAYLKGKNTLSPIAIAVLPLKEDAIKSAEQNALSRIETVKIQLAAANNDLHVAAPYPAHNMGGGLYWAAYYKYSLFQALTMWRENQHVRPHGTCFADVTKAKCDKFIKDAKEQAAEQYERFVEKLEHKIGEVTAAALDGNHVWSYSFLNVTKADGTKETWKTQQITNVSSRGKYFPQWPSRKLKTPHKF